jgi:hypothetical protein
MYHHLEVQQLLTLKLSANVGELLALALMRPMVAAALCMEARAPQSQPISLSAQRPHLVVDMQLLT